MIRRLRFSVAALLTAASLSGATAETPPAADFDRDLAALHATSHVPGFCVIVFDANRTLYEKGFGYADVATHTPYTPQTVQPIGSISKTLIGAMLVKGVDRGWFTLDEDIATFLPFPVRNPGFPDRPITLRQLATHSAGIVDRESVYSAGYRRGTANDLDIAPFLRSYFTPGGATWDRRNFARAAPGAAYAYSNIGATLAAYAVEVKAQQPYAEVTRKEILAPLGMAQSGWTDAASGPQRAVLYDEKLKPLPAYTITTYPDGGLRTSCRDLSKFVAAVLKGRAGEPGLFSKAEVAMMLKPQFVDPIPGLPAKEPNAALFWQYRRDGSVGHYGGDPGVTTFMAIDPRTNIGRIMLSNLGGDKALAKYGNEFAAIWGRIVSQEFASAPPKS